MPTLKRKTMCDECPFRACALKGWLGPLSIDEIEKAVHGPVQFKLPEGSPVPYGYVGDVGELICHKSINAMVDVGKTDEQIHQNGQMFVGFLRYVNSVCKEAKTFEVNNMQSAVEKVPDKPLIQAFQFRNYHSSGALHSR